jgi:hypothetical protein
VHPVRADDEIPAQGADRTVLVQLYGAGGRGGGDLGPAAHRDPRLGCHGRLQHGVQAGAADGQDVVQAVPEVRRRQLGDDAAVGCADPTGRHPVAGLLQLPAEPQPAEHGEAVGLEQDPRADGRRPVPLDQRHRRPRARQEQCGCQAADAGADHDDGAVGESHGQLPHSSPR